MATILSFLSGRQITNNNGAPQAGALVYHYQAGTTNNLTVYSNQAGTTPHAQPVVCDAGGFVPLIYVDDTSDWKIVVQTSGAVTLQTYDNLPKAVAEISAANFAPPLLEWTQVTSAASPVALTAADAGKAYEANTTAGSIEFDLPSAASVGNGKGFWFKKTASANTMTLDPSGSETIDDSATSLAVTQQYQVIFIASNGAEWYIAAQSLEVVPSAQLTAASDTAQGALEIAVQSEMETATDVLRAVVPGRQHYHPGSAKAWVKWDGAGTTVDASYNVTSITDNGVGDFTVAWATDFSTANYAACALVARSGGDQIFVSQKNGSLPTAGTFRVAFYDDAGNARDGTWASAMAFGDHA
jgi:hypothetical protein